MNRQAFRSEQTQNGPNELEALKARLAVAETQLHSIDGGEQDLREQLRNMRMRLFRAKRITKDDAGREHETYALSLDEDASLEAQVQRLAVQQAELLARIPPTWTQKTIVSFMVTVAMALVAKALGVPMPEIAP
jgi:hypothetical protein